MIKICFLGAGSIVFTFNLINDIFLTPALTDCSISLMDIDSRRLNQAQQLVDFVAQHHRKKVRVEVTTDRRRALHGADYVIASFQVGGLEAYAMDIDIPTRYGVEQCVGDTLGPGGVFRALRTVPVFLDICRDLDDVATPAVVLNYVNPMATISWAVMKATGRPYVGLCHSVQETSDMLARWIDVPPSEVNFLCAGINHQAFFLRFRRGKEDLYPRIREVVQRGEIYGEEPVRIELFKHFGYFVTESSGHASEYLPYFRKNARMVDELVSHFTNQKNHWYGFGKTGGYLQYNLERVGKHEARLKDVLSGREPLPAIRSLEYMAKIMEAIEANQPTVFNGNVANERLIDNLPRGCCVEVPCMADGGGIHPIRVGNLPAHLAAINRTNINVQELTVEALLRFSKEAVYHAVMMDPLTAAVCTLDQIRAMVDEMFEAERKWLPVEWTQ